MSRIGNTPISLPSGVSITLSTDQVQVIGPKGTVAVPLFKGIKVAQEDAQLMVSRTNNLRQVKAWHGLVRSLLNNAVEGVSAGFQKRMKVVGTGYRAQVKGGGLSLSVGLSHAVDVKPLVGTTLKLEGNDIIVVDGIDKAIVGQMAADLRAVRPPEVYKGKGIRYEDEYIKLKPGKTAAA